MLASATHYGSFDWSRPDDGGNSAHHKQDQTIWITFRGWKKKIWPRFQIHLILCWSIQLHAKTSQLLNKKIIYCKMHF